MKPVLVCATVFVIAASTPRCAEPSSRWPDRRWKAPYFWAGFVLQGDWK